MFQGYGLKLTGTIAEWLLAFSTMFFVLTYMKEFKLFRMFPPECSHKKEKMNSYNIEGIGNGLP